MATHDGRWSLLFNGEISHFAQLRADLERRRHRVSSTGDTEVLLQALAADGEDALAQLRHIRAGPDGLPRGAQI